ncbi:hypothetical protein T261_8447 [Streptomyces lydicus]|nr:hypothetical protein T261_8447 [Streptomyces lydicus]
MRRHRKRPVQQHHRRGDPERAALLVEIDGRLYVRCVAIRQLLCPSPATRHVFELCDALLCHTFGRGEGKHPMVPCWPYSIVAAPEAGRTSSAAVLDAVRLEPGADVAAVTTHQIRDVVERSSPRASGSRATRTSWSCWTPDTTHARIAHLLAGPPVEILGRLRSDRVMRRPTPPRVHDPKGGRLPKRDGAFIFGADAANVGLLGDLPINHPGRYARCVPHRAQSTDLEHCSPAMGVALSTTSMLHRLRRP